MFKHDKLSELKTKFIYKRNIYNLSTTIFVALVVMANPQPYPSAYLRIGFIMEGDV